MPGGIAGSGLDRSAGCGLAAYKRPRSVRFVPDLPKTSTGKVMRRELKNLDS